MARQGVPCSACMMGPTRSSSPLRPADAPVTAYPKRLPHTAPESVWQRPLETRFGNRDGFGAKAFGWRTVFDWVEPDDCRCCGLGGDCHLTHLARERVQRALLRPGGVFGPGRAVLRAMLLSVRTLDVAGFDLRGFNVFANGRANKNTYLGPGKASHAKRTLYLIFRCVLKGVPAGCCSLVVLVL